MKKELIYHSEVHSGVVVDTCFRYLALGCSSSDLELDHLRLELEMKGATAVFAKTDCSFSEHKIGWEWDSLCV